MQLEKALDAEPVGPPNWRSSPPARLSRAL